MTRSRRGRRADGLSAAFGQVRACAGGGIRDTDADLCAANSRTFTAARCNKGVIGECSPASMAAQAGLAGRPAALARSQQSARPSTFHGRALPGARPQSFGAARPLLSGTSPARGPISADLVESPAQAGAIWGGACTGAADRRISFAARLLQLDDELGGERCAAFFGAVIGAVLVRRDDPVRNCSVAEDR
jgi:hypothetical protein